MSEIDIDVIHAIVKKFVGKTSRFVLREDDYTRRFASQLAEHFSEEIVTAIGGWVDNLQEHLGESSRYLKEQYLPKAKDIYPDITILQPVDGLTRINLQRFEELGCNTQIRAIFECKYSRSFPSATYKHFLQDSAKLEILGEYCQSRFGTVPLLVQLIFDFKGTYANKNVLKQYADAAIQADFRHVHVLLVDRNGECKSLLQEA